MDNLRNIKASINSYINRLEQVLHLSCNDVVKDSVEHDIENDESQDESLNGFLNHLICCCESCVSFASSISSYIVHNDEPQITWDDISTTNGELMDRKVDIITKDLYKIKSELVAIVEKVGIDIKVTVDEDKKKPETLIGRLSNIEEILVNCCCMAQEFCGFVTNNTTTLEEILKNTEVNKATEVKAVYVYSVPQDKQERKRLVEGE